MFCCLEWEEVWVILDSAAVCIDESLWAELSWLCPVSWIEQQVPHAREDVHPRRDSVLANLD